MRHSPAGAAGLAPSKRDALRPCDRKIPHWYMRARALPGFEITVKGKKNGLKIPALS